MKTYDRCILLFCFFASSCAGNKASDVPKKVQEETVIDFAASGLENLNASNSMKDILCQCWDYKEDAADAKLTDAASNIEVVYRGYCLFSDGTMVKDPRGNMQTGKWNLDNKVKPVTLSFSFNNGETETNQLAYLMPYEMKLVRKGDEKKQIVDLGANALRHTRLADDPFYSSNNLWRLKPGKMESDEQLKNRLKGCIHFFILFYDEQIGTHAETINFTGLPSCFRWYSGGIFLQKETSLQDKWINTYFNRDQAMKAYKLAADLLAKKYTWPEKESNWLKLNVAVLKQMEQRIDSL